MELPPTAPSASSLSQGSCVSPRCCFKGITLQKRDIVFPNHKFLPLQFLCFQSLSSRIVPLGFTIECTIVASSALNALKQEYSSSALTFLSESVSVPASICRNDAHLTTQCAIYSFSSVFDRIFSNPVFIDSYCCFGHEVADCRSKSFSAELFERGFFGYFHGPYPISTTLVCLVCAMSICTRTFFFILFNYHKTKFPAFFCNIFLPDFRPTSR